MGLNCQSFANDCDVNASAFLQARAWVRDLLLDMRSEEKIRAQGRLSEHVDLHWSANPARGGGPIQPRANSFTGESHYQQRQGIRRPSSTDPHSSEA